MRLSSIATHLLLVLGLPALLAAPPTADFNGDGRSDLLWRNAATGDVFCMPMSGATVLPGAVVHTEPDPSWQIVATGDFDGDGRSDILWWNNGTGQVWLMLMNGASVKSQGLIYTEPDTSWRIAGTGDFDGDGCSDILWRNSATGAVYLMPIKAGKAQPGQVIHTEPNPAWRIVAIADFDGDGKADILWWNSTTGQVWQMLMNGFAIRSQGSIYSEPDTRWSIAGAGDFNGDGRADLVWRNSDTGQVYLMPLAGAMVLPGTVVYTEPDPAWKIVGTGDYDGDGKADLLWWNSSTGQVWQMLMNGAAIRSQGQVYVEPNTAWTPQAGCAASTTWRFAVLGDCHVPTAIIAGEMASAMVTDGIDLALFPGDLTESGAGASAATFAGQLGTWQGLVAPLRAAGIPLYPVRGNHENDANQSVATWDAAFSGTWLSPGNGPSGEVGLTYAFTRKNALFVGLDEYVNIHQVNQAWLNQQLAGNHHPHVFAFGHEPAFKVFHTDCLDNVPAARDTFWNSLGAAGARIYLCGHDHFFDVARIDDGDGNPGNDLYQVVVGTGGGSLFDQYLYDGANSTWLPVGVAHLEAYGYLLVEVSGDSDNDRGVTLTFKQRTVAANGAVSYAPAWHLSYTATSPAPATPAYPVVDTAETACYDTVTTIPAPAQGAPFYGQDAQHAGLQPSYKDNGDGTVSDLVTGLMWVKARGSQQTWTQASAGATTCAVAGHRDWRMPTIKELYSLIEYTGAQGASMTSTAGYIPFIDTSVFDFTYGPTGSSAVGSRVIDCQDWSSSLYVGTVMNNQSAAFGVNFADGRIKGYPTVSNNYVRYVRANPSYGQNALASNGDGTVTDSATGLMWTQSDSGAGLDWQAALAWVAARNAQNYLGHADWRLPNAKEMQSLVDYARAPQAGDAAKRGPAIDPLFSCTTITAEDGSPDYPFYWTSTSFKDGTPNAVPAAYLAFGRALGWMQLQGESYYTLVDAHGAGAQRSDPKAGNPTDYPLGKDIHGNQVYGRGPQGDVVRIYNFVRLVRDAR